MTLGRRSPSDLVLVLLLNHTSAIRYRVVIYHAGSP